MQDFPVLSSSTRRARFRLVRHTDAMAQIEAAPEPQTFDLGMRVVLRGLKAKPGLNEQLGKVCLPAS